MIKLRMTSTMLWAALLPGLACFGAAPASAAAPRPTPADLVLANGIVRVGMQEGAVASALAVSAGRIVYVGDDAGARKLRGPRTRFVDLAGRAVLPGLADAHVHPFYGEYLHHFLCDVRAFSVEEGLRRAGECISHAPPGDWVVGYGWYDLDNADFDHVTRTQLSAVAPGRKLVVVSRDIHTMWANPEALATLGIDRDRPNPPGGEIVRDARSGEPTGMLIDAANQPLLQAVQHASPYAATTRDVLRAAVGHLHSLGITSILDAYADDDLVHAYEALAASGELDMRVELAMPVSPANFRTEIPRIAALRAQLRSPLLRIDYIKVIGDGNPEVGLSNLLHHDGRAGNATPGYFTDGEMRELVALAEQNGLSVFVHAIGDGAARQVLDAVAPLRAAAARTDRRHTITHLCWVADADLPRFRALGVLANIQEGWLAPAAYGGPPGYDYARSTAAGPIGPWMAGRLMPYRALADAGARLAAGSDWFYTDENPWRDIEAGATSMDPGGGNPVPMLPEHALPVPALLEARTSGAAYQMYLEDEVGSIATGRRADLVVVDRDPLSLPPAQLHGVQVELTLFDGRIVYDRATGAPRQ
jgi:predicted amidohydrolase YtcJ